MVGYHTHAGITIRLSGNLKWQVGTRKEVNAAGQSHYIEFIEFDTRDEACAHIDILNEEADAIAEYHASADRDSEIGM